MPVLRERERPIIARWVALLWLAALPDCRAANGCLISPDAGQILWPPTLRELPADSFRGCQFLKEVSVPRWVTSIGAYAFTGCPLLRTVVFEDSDEFPSRLTSIGAGAFQDTLIASVVLPRALRYIGDEAFQYAPNIVSMHIPASVVAIGRSSFRCYPSSSPTPSQLTSVTFGSPSSLVVMESYAFDGCSQLEQTSVPPSCFVEEHAFRGTASAYIKEPFPPMPPSPPPALRPGEIDFRVEMQRGTGIAARAGTFVVLMLACMCAACLCKTRRAVNPPPVTVQSIMVIDSPMKAAKQAPPPLGGGRKGGNAHESRLSDLSRRFTELERSFKRRRSRDAPPPPPYTAEQKTRMSSHAGSQDDSERTELGLESSSFTPRGPPPAARLPPPALSSITMANRPRTAPPISLAPISRPHGPAATPSVPSSPSSHAPSDDEPDGKHARPTNDPPVVDDTPAHATFTSKADWRSRRYRSSGASAAGESATAHSGAAQTVAAETAAQLAPARTETLPAASLSDVSKPRSPPEGSKFRDRRATATDHGSSMSSAGAFEVDETRGSDSEGSEGTDVEDRETPPARRLNSFDEENEEESGVGGTRRPASRAAHVPSDSESEAADESDEPRDRRPDSLKV